jgi:hypothetical protein
MSKKTDTQWPALHNADSHDLIGVEEFIDVSCRWRRIRSPPADFVGDMWRRRILRKSCAEGCFGRFILSWMQLG